SELDFARRYLELEGIRFEPRLKVEVDVAPETLDARVPGLILQPLLENAIKHGIAPFSKPGQITIFARREQDALVLRVTDNGPGLPEAKDISTLPGIGLRNTRARLQTLYRDQHRIDFKTREGGGLAVEIAIPFRAALNQPARANHDYEDSHAHC